MNTQLVLEKVNNGQTLSAQELGVLMLHAIDLLKHFNQLTQKRINELITNQVPLAA